jgi:class 3 adenylate cyclase
MDETPPTRIGDPERNQVLEVLSRATAEGRLTMDEFSDRSGAAFAAATREELEALVADLPRDTGTLPVPSPGTYPSPATAGSPGTGALPATPGAPGATPARGRKRFIAIMSGARPRGRWHPPPEVTAFAFWGGAQIDLRDAIIESPVVEITAWAIMGGVEVVVPEGIPVDVDGFVLMGGVVDTTSTAPPLEGAPLIRVKGRGLWGGVTVRTGKPRRSREQRLAEGGGDRDHEPDEIAHVADDITAYLPPRVAEKLTGHLARKGLPPPTIDDLIPPILSGRRPARPGRLAGPGFGPHGPYHPHGRSGWSPGPPAPTPPAPPPPPATPARPTPPQGTPPVPRSEVPHMRVTYDNSSSAGDDMDPTPAEGVGIVGEGPGAGGNVRPTGRVLTMLVSDICDSTTTAVEMGDQRWVAVLAAHDTLVREQVRRHHGTEVKAQGDGFIVTFTSARQAVLAGIAIQDAMALHRSTHPDLDLHVRLGIHTGEVVERDGDIFGQNVVVAVRVCDVAVADEVLVSGMTRDITEASGDLRFDAGRETTLKGLSKPSRVYAAAWG